jgi:NAD+ diphosphatase
LLTRKRASLHCTACNHEIFPVISPAVIVGLVHNGKLLVTRYADRPYTGPALVAGYCEVGETAETTCIREALEETGLQITRLRYFASQPWGLSGSLLLGYFAETASDAIRLDDHELAEAVWLDPNELPPPPDTYGTLSLTATMIQAFARGEVTFD